MTPVAKGAPGRHERSAVVDQAVLSATIELAGEVGITKLSMDDVAEHAKVSKATIYRRWASKEALVLDALQSAISPLDEPDTGTLRRRPGSPTSTKWSNASSVAGSVMCCRT